MSFLKYQNQNPEFLNNYLKYKGYIEFGAKTTVNEAYFDLRTLFRYIKLYLYDKEKLKTITKEEFKTISIKDVTIDDLSKIDQFIIEKYIIFLSNTLENTAKTRNKKLATTKRFFEFLEINNLIGISPARGLSCARVEKRIPKHLELNECKKLLAKTINSEDKYKIRNYAITCVFLNCSLRLSELVNIDLTDLKIDDSEQTLKVHGKGNKERLIYLNSAVCEAITCYLKVRTPLGKDNKDCNALFLSARDKRISNRMVQTIIKENLMKVIDENKNPEEYHTHTLRHSGATLLYNENDIDIFVLKKILGHESLAATEIYTHVSDKKLKNIMETCTISSILERSGGNLNERIKNT